MQESVWSMLSQLSKAFLFLSLQKVQNKHNGATFQAFFFSNKGSMLAQLSQLSKAFLFLSPKGPKQTQRSNLPSLFFFFSNKGPMLTQKDPSNWRVHHSLDTKKRKNQLLQNVSFQTMNENMVSHFFFFLTHVASIRNPPASPFELI